MKKKKVGFRQSSQLIHVSGRTLLDGELEEGEVEEEFDENPQRKDGMYGRERSTTTHPFFSLSPWADAKENTREDTSNTNSTAEQDQSIDATNQNNLGSQKFRRRDYQQHHQQQHQPHLGQPRLNSSGGPQDKRNKHEQRRKRRHSGEERDDRNRKLYKVGRRS